MQLATWLDQTTGIRHAEEAFNAGFTRHAIRAAVAGGAVTRIRRWLATPAVGPELRSAAAVSGRVSCVSAARLLGLWTVDDARLHLAVAQSASRFDARGATVHWGAPVLPPNRFGLIEPLVDALVRIADCQPLDHALAAWESALRTGRVRAGYLEQLPLRSTAARHVRLGASQLSDSGIESIPVARLRRIGIRLRQQVMIDGHPVDILIGERLVLQIDGFEFHRTAEQRERDLAQDRRLVLMGYTVFRYGYVDVLYRWPEVESEVRHALGARLDVAKGGIGRSDSGNRSRFRRESTRTA